MSELVAPFIVFASIFGMSFAILYDEGKAKLAYRRGHRQGYDEGLKRGYSTGQSQSKDVDLRMHEYIDSHVCERTKKLDCGCEVGIATEIRKDCYLTLRHN